MEDQVIFKVKICSKCSIAKNETEFRKNHKQCRECINEYNKIYYIQKYKKYKSENPDKVKKWHDDYKEKNTEKVKESNKKWRDNNKEKIKTYQLENKEISKKANKKWRDNNKEKIKEISREYYLNNKEKVNKNNREYFLNNKEKVNSRLNVYYKERRENDILYKLKVSIRNLIRDKIRRGGFTKESKTNEILGCDYLDFILYIESMFESWMSWENYGLYNSEFNYGWDIDHIIPTSSANTEEDIIKLNHYTNLQPLCSKINRDIKKDKIEYDDEI